MTQTSNCKYLLADWLYVRFEGSIAYIWLLNQQYLCTKSCVPRDYDMSVSRINIMLIIHVTDGFHSRRRCYFTTISPSLSLLSVCRCVVTFQLIAFWCPLMSGEVTWLRFGELDARFLRMQKLIKKTKVKIIILYVS